jgi:hypothetical protein
VVRWRGCCYMDRGVTKDADVDNCSGSFLSYLLLLNR